MGRSIDLTGKRFGRLCVIKNDGYLNNQKAWLCKCDCGNEVRVRSYDLRNNTRSCGCLAIDRTKESHRKKTNYEIKGDVAICWTSNGYKFYIDKEDVERVVNRSWYCTPRGYVVGHESEMKGNSYIFLHRFIIGNYNCEFVIDHIDRNKLNNCKSNLRVCKVQENIWNTSTKKNNTSGFTGVDFHKGKWRARISVNHKSKHIGYYKSFGDAVKARYEAEKKYFGEFTPHTEQIVTETICDALFYSDNCKTITTKGGTE